MLRKTTNSGRQAAAQSLSPDQGQALSVRVFVLRTSGLGDCYGQHVDTTRGLFGTHPVSLTLGEETPRLTVTGSRDAWSFDAQQRHSPPHPTASFTLSAKHPPHEGISDRCEQTQRCEEPRQWDLRDRSHTEEQMCPTLGPF